MWDTLTVPVQDVPAGALPGDASETVIGRAPEAGDARVLVAIFVPPLLLILLVAAIAVMRDLDTGAIFRDPVSVLEGYPLVGALSNMGVVLWWLGAAVLLFCFSLGRPLGMDRPIRIFLLTSGLLSVLLAVDDQFLIHDGLASELFGLRERHVMLGYLALVGAWALVNIRVIRRTEWLILAIAGACFVGSIGSDYVVQAGLGADDEIGLGLDWGIVIEDGLKFIGIAGWTAYFLRFSHRVVRDRAAAGDGSPLEANEATAEPG